MLLLEFSCHYRINSNPDVGEGNVDVGITGIDVVEESNVDVDRVMVSASEIFNLSAIKSAKFNSKRVPSQLHDISTE